MHSKHVLYLGLNPTNLITQDHVTHLPLIQIIPYPLEQVKSELEQFSRFTHILLTSKSTVSILIPYLENLGYTHKSWNNKIIAAVGQATAQHLKSHGLPPDIIAKEETAEGLIAEMETLTFEKEKVFWPHSKLARPLLKEYFFKRGIAFTECILYETLPLQPNPLPKLEEFDQIIFTSPSTVDAFLKFYDTFPKNKVLLSIGPVTEQYLKTKLAKLD